MTSSWSAWLAAQAAAREAAGLTRTLRPRASDDTIIDLAGNDYLGFALHPSVRAAAARAAEEWGGGAGASRLVTGTLALHAELEASLARLMQQPAALVFSTGYHANLGVVTALADRDARIISDAHVHASLIDAARLSRAAIEVVPHNDVEAVVSKLAASTSQASLPATSLETPAPRTLVLVESIYSVLGDAAPLTELAAACENYGALLVVDEAHGLGVHGPGLVARLGLAGLEHVVVTATLSKALGSQGGAVLGSSRLIEHLVNRARPFIFDTGLAPAAAAAALAATHLIQAHPELPVLIRRRVDNLAALLGVPAPDGAVLSVPMLSPQTAAEAAVACAERGVRVGCFRPPSVPDGVSRLRVTCSAGVGDEQWAAATQVLLEVTKEAAR